MEAENSDSITMVDVLEQQAALEEDAHAVLGGSDDKECTYQKGYVKRQALYACLTCCPETRAGLCLACSLSCHENHELVELYTKRNFRCDCGGPSFPNKPCTFGGVRTEPNNDNKYNQNFSGLYCKCSRPYPDPDLPDDDDEMIQCIVCEDWLHSRHLNARVPPHDRYSEMICEDCINVKSLLKSYLAYKVPDDGSLDATLEATVNSSGFETTMDTSVLDATVISVADINDAKIDETNPLQKEKLIDETNSVNNEKIIQLPPEDKMEVETENSAIVVDSNKPKIEEALLTNDVPALESEITPMETDDVKNIIDDLLAKTDVETLDENLSKSVTEISDLNKAVDSISFENNEMSTAKNEELNSDTKATPSDVIDDVTLIVPVQVESGEKTEELIETKTENGIEPIETSTENGIESEATAENVIKSEDVQKDEIKSEDIQKDEIKSEDATDKEIKLVNTTKTEEVVESVGTKLDEVEPDNNETKSEVETKVESESTEGMPEALVKDETSPEVVAENIDIKPVASIVELKQDIVENNETKPELEIKSNLSTKDEQNPEELTKNGNGNDESIKKRKIDSDDVEECIAKKSKVDDMCSRPNEESKTYHKGAVFWPFDWRTKLCSCLKCTDLYKKQELLFLFDNEDTVDAYENLGKMKTVSSSSQYDKGLEALSSLGRIQQINAITEYNKMKEKLMEFLKTFQDKSEVVREEDIKGFFAGMKPKREPDGVYFCR